MSDTKINISDSNYVVIKSESKGCKIIGMTRGNDTRIHHTENLDNGEVIMVQFTNNTSAIKVRGKAKIYTNFGIIESGNEGEQE